MKAIEAFFLITQIYFITTSINVIGKKCKKNSSTSKGKYFSMNTTIEYFNNEIVKDGMIETTLKSLEDSTCMKFVKTNDSLSSNTIVFEKGDHCSAIAEIINGTVRYSIYVDKSCMNYYSIIKLMNLNILMRYQLTKCLATKKDHIQLPMKGNIYYDLIKIYSCKIKTLNGAFVAVFGGSLIFSTLNIPRRNNVEPKDLQQIDYTNVFSFDDAKKINEIMCAGKCKNKNKVKCKNGGYLDPKSCQKCKCPWFYSGPFCKTYMISELKPPFKRIILKSRSKQKILKLNLNKQCIYYIEPSSKRKKIKVIFNVSKPIPWDCKSYPFIEVKYYNDKTKTGLIPCGNIKSFNVKSSKGAVVMIRHENLRMNNYNIILKYKEIRN